MDYLRVQDVTLLSDMCTGEKLLEYLKIRYENDVIYSNVGDILVSINPYKRISGEEYLSDATVPHVYNVSKRIYEEMKLTCYDQCCVISGESGAGKTEVCKYLVKYLTQFSGIHNNLELRILQMNPLLEGFGNAQTTMNSNSSRFGKYVQLKFNQLGKVTGAKINEYLLEKSRVVYQNPGERNFHIFYWMLGGLDPILKMNLHLHEKTNFRYLGGSVGISGDENERFKELKECLDFVGFKEEEQEDIFMLIASILHLGNINVEEDDNEHSVIPQSSTLDIASHLLGVDSESLMKLLTVTVSTARGETIYKHLNKIKAEATRDAISKAVYDRLFRWIVNQINHLLAPTLEEIAWSYDIGILDIFGFEDFVKNSFEQLCINLANEQLHNFFIQHIFHMELDQYTEEGVEGVDINVPDTQYLLDSFFLGSKSVFHLLDDQVSVPRATDINFLHKLNERLKKEKFYTAPKTLSGGTFTISHYAGKIVYSVNGFLDKNMDTLPLGVKKSLEDSNNELVSLLFRASVNVTGTLSLHKTTTSRISRKNKARKGRASITPTISSQYKSSLTVLVSKMSSATPHFIRCLKPNKIKQPNQFDEEFMKRQLRYNGMMDTIHIRREGFAYRPTFQDFHERFGCLSSCSPHEMSLVDICQLILIDAGITNDQYQLGHSKLFLRHYHLEELDERVRASHRAASKLQSVALGFIERRRYQKRLKRRREHRATIERLMKAVKERSMKIESRLERLANQDEKRHLDDERESTIIQQLSFFLPKLSPPSDLRELPPPLLLSSDDEGEGERKESLRKKSSRLRLDDTMFVKVELRRPHQQARMLRSSVSSSHSWLHGMISQKKAEEMLRLHPHGTFLVRINRKKLSHILSYKSTNDSINHLPISQLPNSKYILSGETTAHISIDDLVEHYSHTLIKGSNDVLVLPCPEEIDQTEIKIEISEGSHIVV